jgi:hypothetical protein
VPFQGHLREDELVVEDDFEAPLRRRDELVGGDDVGPSGEDLVRQTDGSRCVVSGDAELDAETVSLVGHLILPVRPGT